MFGRTALLLLPVAIGTLAIGTAAQAGAARPVRNLAWLVQTLDRTSPLTARELAAIVGPLRCGATSACSRGPMRLHGSVVGEVSFRRCDGGSLLVLDHVTGACIPSQALVPPGASLSAPSNGCTDGVTWLYRTVNRARSALRLGVDGPGPAACTRSVVFEWRR